MSVVLSPSLSDRPSLAFARSLAIGTALAGLAAATDFFYGNRPWSQHIPGLLLVGNVLASAVWGADRLSLSALGPMLRKPSSPLGYAARLPFWYFSGAIGAVSGLLIAKRWNLLTVFDIPVKNLFSLGGKVGIGVGITMHLLGFFYRFMRRDPRRTT